MRIPIKYDNAVLMLGTLTLSINDGMPGGEPRRFLSDRTAEKLMSFASPLQLGQHIAAAVNILLPFLINARHNAEKYPEKDSRRLYR